MIYFMTPFIHDRIKTIYGDNRKYVVYDYSSFISNSINNIPNINILAPNMVFQRQINNSFNQIDLDWDITYDLFFNTILSNSDMFSIIFEIAYAIYSGKDVIILVNDSQETSNEFLSEVFADRYGIKSKSLYSDLDIIDNYLIDENKNEMTRSGIETLLNDRDNWYNHFSDINDLEERINSELTFKGFLYK